MIIWRSYLLLSIIEVEYACISIYDYNLYTLQPNK